MKKVISLMFLMGLMLSVFAQKFTIDGHVRDKTSGEELIGAAIYVSELQSGTITNVYGYYSITLNAGTYNVVCSFLGYDDFSTKIKLDKDTKLSFELSEKSLAIEEIVVVGEKKDKNVKMVEMSVQKLQMKNIKKIPALMGEVDVIKNVQMMPGVQTAGEGTSGFFVRGGGVDQNLILLDEATVYNSMHLGGIFSVFNPDAIKDVKLYKGGIPAEYGGRLSSVLDIRQNDGNSHNYAVQGGFGIISGRLAVEGPLVKDKGSFITTYRRTWVDIFFPFFDQTKDSKFYFHDFNGKLNYRFDENNRLFVSGYFGRDVVSFGDMFKMWYGNYTLSIRYNHIFSNKLFMNVTGIYSHFNYGMEVDSEGVGFNWNSDIIDRSIKNDFTWYLNPNNTIKFGWGFIRHSFKPGYAEGADENSFFNDLTLPNNHAYETSAFIMNEQKIGNLFSMNYGLRWSMFNNIGKGVQHTFDKSNPEEYVSIARKEYDKGHIYNTFSGFEPRLGMRLQLSESSSLKASYNHTIQYVHLASNTTAVTPLDLWFPSTPNVKPQNADQYAFGWFKNFSDNMYETSVEVYYKEMNNSIDFKDHAELLLNEEFEGELRFGKGHSYGAEFLLKKQEGRLTGWVGYTYSRVFKKIPEINGGKEYAAEYDKPHDISIVLTYQLTDRLTLSANWLYSTGAPRTMPTGMFSDGNQDIPIYSERNEIRLPDYHRLDLGCTYDTKNINRHGNPKLWHGSWTLSIYNAYSRHNAYSVTFGPNEDDPTIREATKLYLFKIFPTVTYNFDFDLQGAINKRRENKMKATE